ncbi:sensor histidine kinase [Paenibacillus chibensis]|uniref:sensor histidine kinase n=1 Tax=Paenibacillus chibensis TaxID=59846 RepID=UPI000FD85F59|nr:histidine kinase [Paenibacillus chibensis]MEC0368364.1 histidine kinase [Paenibacillus chibensis]
MELWTIGNKAIVLLYVVIVTYFSDREPSRWMVLLVLIYAALNLALHIVKNARLKRALLFAVLAYTIGCAWREEPNFILLLPLSLCELTMLLDGRRRYAPLLAMLVLPGFALRGHELISYVFIAMLTFVNYALIGHYTAKANRQEDAMDRLRRDVQRLAKKQNDNDMFARTSEYMVKLEERNRLAQEIHDGLGHAMTGALIQMEAAKRLLNSDPAMAGTLLQNAIGISKEGIEEIRLTLKNNKPLVEQLGLNRLKSAVESFGMQSDLRTIVVHEGNMEAITPLQWKIIHENVIECLTNAAKYASATAVNVEVRVLNRFIQAVVSDNGKGAGQIVKGLGLLGMEERTASVSGTVIADGSSGFTVTTLIPYGRG